METRTLHAFIHKSIGAKTHKPKTATAHKSYIMRSEAMSHFQARNMPDGGYGTRVYFDKQWEKAGSPENARIADKFMIALPIELSPEQRREVIASFMDAVGQGRIAWCAAHHDQGKDAHNPHAHIVFKDADVTTGRKVIGITTSAKDVREAKKNGWKVPPRMTTLELRHAWCDHLNRFMEREGFAIRFDARSYKDRGIDRQSGIHIGPKAQELARNGHKFQSRDFARKDARQVQALPYSLFDEGSRAEHNARIQRANQDKAALEGKASGRLAEPVTPNLRDIERQELRQAQAEERLKLYDQQKRDRALLRQAHETENTQHRQWASDLYAKAREAAYQKVKTDTDERWRAALKMEQGTSRDQELARLKRDQKTLYADAATREVGKARPVKDNAWKEMKAAQEKEREQLGQRHREETAALARQQTAEKFAQQEKWRAYSLDGQAHRLEARLSARQGLAAQQSAANAALRLSQRARSLKTANGPRAASPNPLEVFRLLLAQAQAEKRQRAIIRAGLNDGRDCHLRRAAAPVRRSGPGLPGRPRSAAPEDPQSQIRQAIEAGLPLTDAARANAAPDLKERIANRELKPAQQSLLALIAAQGNQKGKGHSRGGRGR
jgi:hypothetical protein